MDFRQVEKKFRLAALLIQVVLCSFLLCFLGFSFKQILDSSADPPVETTTVQWRKGLGLWALCSQSSGSLFGVGTASDTEIWGYHDREKALAGAQLSEPEAMNFSLSLSPDSAHIDTLNCSFVDLTNIEIEIPFLFSLCIDSDTYNIYLVKVKDRWQWVNHQNPGSFNWYSLRKVVHGWNFGYSTNETDVFVTNQIFDTHEGGDRTYECHAGMKYFQSPGGRAKRSSVLRLLARDPMVIVYHKQGIMPQLFKLISSTGRYISCLTLMFLSCFVRKYPESAVVQIYEARTLVLERIWSNEQRPKDDSKPKEKPVALPLPPGLFTQLGRDTE